jgi:glycosyltransferase involved in cell wall biosynthesis/GT2 family glycosyltransferase
LDYSSFEVCVVYGPTEDGTRELLRSYEGRIKCAPCRERNLSKSRNIGIALASGEIVAFIDDDGLPEPEWLKHLAVAFEDSSVGGAGGIVYDHTSCRIQYRYSSANRLGQADWARQTPADADAYDFPFSFNFPYVQGTNSAFRRSALIEIGGFDEEFEFYLDETDVCCRLVDAGYRIRQLPNAFVHHKFLPSQIRNEHRITRDRYSVLKNKIYFSLVNNHGHYGVEAAIQDGLDFARTHEQDIRHCIERGLLAPEDLESFRGDAARAWEVGLARGLNGQRRLLRTEVLANSAIPFLEFPRLLIAEKRRTFCFISQEYPPGQMGGIGRYIHQLARSVADLGHHVHVITRGEGDDRVDFEDRVWVHRILSRFSQQPALPGGIRVPQHIWDRAATALSEVVKIADHRHVDSVYAPIWDCEGLAIVLDGRFPIVTGLQTTLHFWMSSQPHLRSDQGFMADFVTPMLVFERQVLEGSTRIHAISFAIASDIEQAYNIRLPPSRLAVVPLGLEDVSAWPCSHPPPLRPGTLRLLFVGRLEARKGIDVLLAAAKRLLPRYAHVNVDIVGNDRIPGPDGIPYRKVFEDDPAAAGILERVTFHREVSDESLRGFYRACDVLVVPSRYESFGLVLVEGMMHGKAVVGCRAGGMVEIVEDGTTGLLAEPNDAASLEACLIRLIEDAALRERIAAGARKRYVEKFTAMPTAAKVVEILSEAADAAPLVQYKHMSPTVESHRARQ